MPEGVDPAGLVRIRRDGTRVYYGLSSERVEGLWAAVRSVAEAHVAGLDRLARDYLGERAGLEAIGRDALQARLARGEVVVLDVRPAAEYAAGHIAAARSLPIAELRRQLHDLPADCTSVAYCGGPCCVYADDAVRRLRERGYRAARLKDGFPEWRNAGLPVAAGAASASA